MYGVASDENSILRGAYELSTAFEASGNVEKSANNTTDGGNDGNRLEIGNFVAAAGGQIDTSLATIATTATTDTDTKFAITNVGTLK